MEQIRIMIYAQKLNILQSKIIQEFWYRINYAGATLLTKSLQKGKITLVDPTSHTILGQVPKVLKKVFK